MIRFRFIIILILMIITSVLSSIVLTHRAVNQVQRKLEQEIIQPLSDKTEKSGDKELLKILSYYQAFRENTALMITREISMVFAVELLIIGLIALLVIVFITKPLDKLAKRLDKINWSDEKAYQAIEETGSEEVRSLVRSYNGAIGRLREYSGLIGNMSRFKGWKEIGRVIVHEVNNILSPLQTYIQLLTEHQDGKNAEIGALLMANLSQVKVLLSRLREMSHLPEAILLDGDLTKEIQDVVLEFDADRVVFEGVSGKMIACFDSTLLREVIRNIIRNALETGSKTNVKVRLTAKPKSVEISISDNGPGIDTGKTDRIFEPGYSTKEGNLGIGLSITRHIIDEHNAELTLDSDLGKGSIFRIILNRREADFENISG